MTNIRLSYLVTVACYIAAILLLVTSISAPVVRNPGILKVKLNYQTDFRHSSITFGSFGHYALDVSPVHTHQDYCSSPHVGYKAADIMTQADGTQLSQSTTDRVNALTHTMVLHPIACSVTFLAFFVSLGAGVIRSLLAALLGCLAYIITLVAMAIDLLIFGVIKNHVSDHANISGSHANYTVGMWTIYVAIMLLNLWHIHRPRQLLPLLQGSRAQTTYLQDRRRDIHRGYYNR